MQVNLTSIWRVARSLCLCANRLFSWPTCHWQLHVTQRTLTPPVLKRKIYRPRVWPNSSSGSDSVR